MGAQESLAVSDCTLLDTSSPPTLKVCTSERSHPARPVSRPRPTFNVLLSCFFQGQVELARLVVVSLSLRLMHHGRTDLTRPSDWCSSLRPTNAKTSSTATHACDDDKRLAVLGPGYARSQFGRAGLHSPKGKEGELWASHTAYAFPTLRSRAESFEA